MFDFVERFLTIISLLQSEMISAHIWNRICHITMRCSSTWQYS